MFETFGVPGLYIAVQAVLALAASWSAKGVRDCACFGRLFLGYDRDGARQVNSWVCFSVHVAIVFVRSDFPARSCPFPPQNLGHFDRGGFVHHIIRMVRFCFDAVLLGCLS